MESAFCSAPTASEWRPAATSAAPRLKRMCVAEGSISQARRKMATESDQCETCVRVAAVSARHAATATATDPAAAARPRARPARSAAAYVTATETPMSGTYAKRSAQAGHMPAWLSPR